MKTDTRQFLETALWIADDPDDDTKPFEGKTVDDFSPEMVEAAESFVDGFRTHLEETGFEMALLDQLERCFGGNVYFSLSGHGCGFFDECKPELSELQDTLEVWSGDRHRFECLASYLEVRGDGKIDLSFTENSIKAYRDKMFKVEKKEG